MVLLLSFLLAGAVASRTRILFLRDSRFTCSVRVRTLCGYTTGMASPSFNYAENVRRETEAGVSRIELSLPRQPQQTTDRLNANAVYPMRLRISCIKLGSA